MKRDWHMRIVLTAIAIFLGILALGPIATPDSARGQAVNAPMTFDDVQFISNGNLGFFMFDKRTGEVSNYLTQSSGKLTRYGPVSRIAKPGAAPQPVQ